jgi:hypothetical protein
MNINILTPKKGKVCDRQDGDLFYQNLGWLIPLRATISSITFTIK